MMLINMAFTYNAQQHTVLCMTPLEPALKIAIIVFVVLSLMGSVMWMMPTRREKYLATLRLEARKRGFTVQLIRVEPPRAQGEYESDTKNVAAYRLIRKKDAKGRQPDTTPWQVFKVDSIANEGLPEGWSWKIGERALEKPQLEVLITVIGLLPEDVVGLESTPIHVSGYWSENTDVEGMDALKAALETLIEHRV
jgi:hypothetical protein